MKAAERQSDEEFTGNVCSEIRDTLAKIKQLEERYKLGANDELVEAAGASVFAEGIKKRSRIDGEEHGKKKMGRGKTAASTGNVRLETY